MKSLKYKLSVITLFQFIKVFEAYFYFSPKFFFRLIVLMPPAVLKQLFPQFTHALIANAFLTFGKSGRGIEMCLIASRFPPSTRYATSMLLDANNNLNKVEEVWNLIRLYLSPEYIPLPEFESVVAWAFWNLSHKDYRIFLQLLKLSIENVNDSELVPQRFLPNFSRNLGHLAAMYLYCKYYETQLPVRKIVILKGVADNKYYLSLVIRNTSLEVIEISNEQFPSINGSNFNQFDNLVFSYVSKNRIRIEADSSHSFSQKYPEWGIAQSDPIKLTQQENLIGYDLMKNKIGDKKFVALHVRQPMKPIFEGQARDSRIEDYRLLCEYLTSIGYIVVRMGDSRFPKLDSDFPAFDYAHSSLRTEFADCWLWANCEFWVGNVSGAMITALTFGKKRLITNQWFWNVLGGKKDLILPKILTKDSIPLTIEDTLSNEFSRCMSISKMRNSGYSLIENTPDEILSGCIDLLNSGNLNSEINDLDKILRNNLVIHPQEVNLMRIAPSFANKWDQILF